MDRSVNMMEQDEKVRRAKQKSALFLVSFLPAPLECAVFVTSVLLLRGSYDSIRAWLTVIAVAATLPGKHNVLASFFARAVFNVLLYSLVTCELFAYFTVRAMIATAEYCVADYKPLRKSIASSQSYDEWYAKTKRLDEAEGRDEWKTPPPEDRHDVLRVNARADDSRHNWSVIEELLLDMRIAREMDDPIAALALLQQSTQRNVGGIMSAEAFSHTNTGEPKRIVTDFVAEVETTTYWLVDGLLGASKGQQPSIIRPCDSASVGGTSCYSNKLSVASFASSELHHHVSDETTPSWMGGFREVDYMSSKTPKRPPQRRRSKSPVRPRSISPVRPPRSRELPSTNPQEGLGKFLGKKEKPTGTLTRKVSHQTVQTSNESTVRSAMKSTKPVQPVDFVPKNTTQENRVTTDSNASNFSEEDYLERLMNYQNVMLQQMRDWSDCNNNVGVYNGGAGGVSLLTDDEGGDDFSIDSRILPNTNHRGSVRGNLARAGGARAGRRVSFADDTLADDTLADDTISQMEDDGGFGDDQVNGDYDNVTQDLPQGQQKPTTSALRGFLGAHQPYQQVHSQRTMYTTDKAQPSWMYGSSTGPGSLIDDGDTDEDNSLTSRDESIINRIGQFPQSRSSAKRLSFRARMVMDDGQRPQRRRLSIGESILNNPGANASHYEQCVNIIRRARASYGRTALCLSGGYSNALSHFGVVKALFEEHVLPPIIAGTSVGSYVAAFLGTRTDEEIKKELQPDLLQAKLKLQCIIWHNTWADKIEKLFTTGSPCYPPQEAFESLQWFCGGDMTFEEAYSKTGRVLNVTATPTSKNASPALLNYLTAPNVTIVSAVMASCAVPILLPARPLCIKTDDGLVVPQPNGQYYCDGSVRMDIPTRSLREFFNCTHFITVQANPSIVPFLFESTGSVGRPNLWESVDGDNWVQVFRGGFVLSALENFFKGLVFQQMSFLGRMSSRASVRDGENERHESDVMIVAKQHIGNYKRLMRDPTEKQMERLMQDGRISTYECMSMLKLHKHIADVLDMSLERFGEAEQQKQQQFPESSLRSQRQSFTYWAANSSQNLMQMLMDESEH